MELIQAFAIQQRVIGALILRETRSRYANSKLGFFWALFEPFANIIIFVGIFSAMSRESPIGDSIEVFILTGIMPWLLFSNIVSKTMSGVAANKALLGYPQVMPLDIIISRVVLEFSTMLIVTLLFLTIAINLGASIKIDNFIELLYVILLLVLFSTGIGLINAAISYYSPSYAHIYNALTKALYFMSGIFFTADFLSTDIYNILYYNPLLHMIEWFRDAFYASFKSNLYDRSFTVSVTLCVFVIGLTLERATLKKARKP